MKNKKAKIIFIDLETGPNLGFVWGKYEQNILEYVKEWELLSFAYKDLNSKIVTCKSKNQFKDKTDATLTKELWKVMNDADVIIAHNLFAFDLKKSNAKFLEHGLKPPSPSKYVDTLKVARKHFKLNSNRLDDLGRLLRVGRKEKTPGFSMWLGCLNNLRWAWRLMRKYNKNDVILLQKVYEKLLPWIDNHPHVSSIEGRPDGCPKCGSEKLQARGVIRTKTSTYRRFQCQSCGGWTRSRQQDKKAKKPTYVNI